MIYFNKKNLKFCKENYKYLFIAILKLNLKDYILCHYKDISV